MSKFLNTFTERVIRSFKTRYLILKDASEVFFGYRHSLIPPKRYDYINIGSNENIGKEFLPHFIKYGGLKPTDSVLEVGSGFGRMAIPLTTYLNKKGSYEGMEIITDGVNWCTSKFTPRYSNFKFQYINVYNERYNPKGECTASAYVFPFKNHTFDFVYLTSVFTHMYPDEISNYLNEIKRVLKKGSKCFITYYLLNEVSMSNIKNNMGTFNFKYQVDHYRIEDCDQPLYQIAFPETFIRALYEDQGLKIEDPMYYGSWSGRKDYLSFQDIVIATAL